MKRTDEYQVAYRQWREAEQAFYKASNELRNLTSPNWKVGIVNASNEIIRLAKAPFWKMALSEAKKEIDRYLQINIDKSDLALIVASWGLSPHDLEEANWYLHETQKHLKKNTEYIGLRLNE